MSKKTPFLDNLANFHPKLLILEQNWKGSILANMIKLAQAQKTLEGTLVPGGGGTQIWFDRQGCGLKPQTLTHF